jgi:hypothetical protein
MQNGHLIPRVITPAFWETVVFRFGNESKQLVTKSINKAIERGIVGVVFPLGAMAVSVGTLMLYLESTRAI